MRVLGNLLGLSGFDQETVDDVRVQALGDGTLLPARLDNSSAAAVSAPLTRSGLQRVADVPIYSTDALVRRAPALQATADGREPQAGLPTSLWQQLGLKAGDRVRVSQGEGTAVLAAREDGTQADHTVRVAAGHPSTAALGALFGTIAVEKV